MMKELIELQKQQVIYQSNHTEILKLMVDAMKRPVEVHLPASDELFQPLDTEPILVELRKMNDLLEANQNRPAQVQIEPIPLGNFGNLPKLPEVEPIEPREKPSPKLEKALEYLRRTKDNRPSREVAAKLGISHTWVNKARQLLESEDAKS
jgi:hypothetical protein